jgi:cardiolipin synthase
MKKRKILAVFIFFLVGILFFSPFLWAGQNEQSARAWLNQSTALGVDEAFWGNKEVYIKFRAYIQESNQFKVFYVKASLPDQDFSSANDLHVPMVFTEETLWKENVAQLKSIPTLEPRHWGEFKKELARRITPEASRQAVSIPTENGEQVYYYDDENQLCVCALKQKPNNITVVKALSQLEFTSVVLETLNDYFHSIDFQEKEVLLTAQENDFIHPFVFVDLNQNAAVNLILPLSRSQPYRGSFLRKGLKSTDSLLVNSHVLGMFNRPFSSAFRFFSWTGGAAYDVLRPKSLSLFEGKKIEPLYSGDGMDLNLWEKKLDKIIGNKPSWGKIQLLIGGEQYFTRMMEALTQAKESIYLRTFIFDNDDFAVQVADLLKSKSKGKNVKVRILLDGMGQIMGEEAYPQTLPAGFVPPGSMAKYLKENSKIDVRVQPNLWLKADHIKTTIIDKEICFTGGMNIGREYRYDWHDLMMEVRGPVVKDILRDFHRTWEYAGMIGDFSYALSHRQSMHAKREGDGYPIRLLYTSVNDPQIFKAQLAAIREAKKYIYINNAYFSDNAILQELIRARRRGVDVRVILPVHGNHEIMNASNIVTANVMFRNGIRVFFYPGMSHIKAAVYDGWMCAGSANFDKLSFRDNLELNLATSDSSTVEELIKNLFEFDFNKSKEMTQLLESGWKEYLAEFFAEQL